MPSLIRTALRRYLVTALALLALPTSAYAATFNVAPVRIELDAQTRTAALTLTNPSDDPVVVKVELVAWGQKDGQEVYTPTADLLVVPPIFTLPPRTSQVVRVALRRAVNPAQELSYRLYLQQQPGAQAAGGVNVQVMLRVGLPVFVNPASASPKLEWSAHIGPDGALALTVHNTGNIHVQLTHLGGLSGANTTVLDEDLSAYVLPGQTRTLTFKSVQPIVPGTLLRLLATTDGGDLNVSLTPER